MQTPDFTEDVGIVLNALHTKQEPLSDSQDSLPRPAKERPRDMVEETPKDRSVNDNSEEERFESWPQPPTSFELQANVSSKNSTKRYNFVKHSGTVDNCKIAVFKMNKKVLPGVNVSHRIKSIYSRPLHSSWNLLRLCPHARILDYALLFAVCITIICH